MKESYEKRLNILVHGLREPDSPWEKREESLILFHDFVRDGLNIDDPTSIAVVDAHRLPQRPKNKQGTRICRPLIVKLATISDKNKIFSHLKNLKNFDETRNSSLLHYKSVYVSNHLSREFVLQKKRLYPQYKKALKLYLIIRNHFGALSSVLTIYSSITLTFSMFMIMFIICVCLFKFATCNIFFFSLLPFFFSLLPNVT